MSRDWKKMGSQNDFGGSGRAQARTGGKQMPTEGTLTRKGGEKASGQIGTLRINSGGRFAPNETAGKK